MLRILIIDDNSDDRSLARQSLLRLDRDLVIIEADSALEAFEILERTEVDCFLCDYQMPLTDGLELLKELRRRGVDTPFIFLTGQGNEGIAAEALRSGADDYFIKGGDIAYYERTLNSIRRNIASSTERRQTREAELALERSELLYRSTIDALQEAYHVVDRDLKILVANKACLDWSRRIARFPGNIVGANLFEAFPFLPQKVRLQYERVFNEGVVLTTEEETGIDGDSYFTETAKIPVFEGGRVTRVVTSMRNITDSKLEREALLRSRNSVLKLLEECSSGTFFIDSQGFVRHADDKAVAKLELTVGERVEPGLGGLLRGAGHAGERDSAGSERDLEMVTVETELEGDRGLLVAVREPASKGAPSLAWDWLEEAFERSPKMMLMLDMAGNLRNANLAWLKSTGFSRDETIGRRVDSFMTPEDAQAFSNDALPDAWRNGSAFNVPCWFVAKDGSVLEAWLDFAIVPQRSGEQVCAVTVHNVSRRRQAERDLKLIQTAFDDASDGILVTGPSGKPLYMNMAFGQRFGLTMADLDFDLRKIYGDPALTAEIISAMENLESWSGEVHSTTPDGQELVNFLRVSAVLNDDLKYLGSIQIFTDITSRKQRERELESFAYTISHDLKTPLSLIDSFSDMLLEGIKTAGRSEDMKYLERIKYNAARMSALIEDLLEFSRMSLVEIKRREINLSAIAGEAAENLAVLYPGRRVGFVIAEGVVAEADFTLLTAAIQNLLDNAFKFTAGQENARIEFGVMDKERPTTYFVRDNGVGFEPALAADLFKPFCRLHSLEEFQGTGIGLATVERIVKRHGGRVWAESDKNCGSTFYFTLA